MLPLNEININETTAQILFNTDMALTLVEDTTIDRTYMIKGDETNRNVQEVDEGLERDTDDDN